MISKKKISDARDCKKNEDKLLKILVKEWFEFNITRAKYQMHHGEDWWWKMNEIHDKLLEKLDESCCEDCITEQGAQNTKSQLVTIQHKIFLYVWFCTKGYESKQR